ncbi:MAG: signal peptidase I [Anaerolineae bacterium]|nr:signal peptidase I [Gloeobacterales cyanobacterium ES-bin-313]
MRKRFFALFLILFTTACALQTDVRLRKVPDSAMEPTLKKDEVVRENFTVIAERPFARFDIVVVKDPTNKDQTLVRRIVAMPGETIQGVGLRILVDGKPLAEPFLPPSSKPPANFGPVRVADGAYFLMGDHRSDNPPALTAKTADIVALIEKP